MNALPAKSASDTPPGNDPHSVERILDWLATPQGQAPQEDLARLRANLPVLSEAPITDSQYHRILDLFFARAQKLATELKPRLRDASLPLPREIRHIARDLGDAHRSIAAGYRHVLADAELNPGNQPVRNPQRIIGRALKCLSEQLEISALVAAPQPEGLWLLANELFQMARHFHGQDSSAGMPPEPRHVYREMLALAAAQPAGLSSQEVAHAVGYLAQFADSVVLLETLPTRPDPSLYWVSLAHDEPPIAMTRRAPAPNAESLLFFSCAKLAVLTDEHIKALEREMNPADMHLPPEAADPAYQGLLQRLYQHWQEPAKRQFPRRRNNYRVQLCIGLQSFWRLLEQKESGMPVLDLGTVSEWMVVNESPSGYALMHVAGDVAELKNGSAVAVRTGSNEAWQVYVVRWMASENPEHIELGLQMVAPGAQAIKIAFRNVKHAQALPALLLDPLPALRQHPAILTLSGSCRSRRFVLVAGFERTYVAQGRMVSLDLQTACIELFQYEPDPYPI